MINEARRHLTEVIIPFWKNMHDEENGGFFGYMDYDLNIDKKAVKGCILHSRILWFFANAYDVLGDSSLLEEAKHAYEFIKNNCIDWINGGIYWSVSYDGKPSDDMKHTYNQAFAIYALSSYYGVTKDEEAINLAYELYKLIETKCRNSAGYLEAFNARFEPTSNEKLSENGVEAGRTMNTLLHILEAYTELYRVTQDKAVAERLKWIAGLWAGNCYNPEKQRQEVFFDYNYKSLIDLHSYGHDVETSWLMDRTVEILGDGAVKAQISPLTKALAARIYERAYVNHSLLNECENGVDDTTRIWWVQAETVVGFLNAYEKSGDKKYLDASRDVFEMILNKFTDKRAGAEWFWKLDENLEPIQGAPIVEPWKCPYHNGRMCFEIIKRNINEEN